MTDVSPALTAPKRDRWPPRHPPRGAGEVGDRALQSTLSRLAPIEVPIPTQQSTLQNGAGFIAISITEPHAPDMPLEDGSAIPIFGGEEDPLYRDQNGLARWQAMWPNCRVETVGGAGRFLQYQRPDFIAKAVHGETKSSGLTPQMVFWGVIALV